MKFPYVSYTLCDDPGLFWGNFYQNKGKLTKSAYVPSFQALYSVTRGVGFGSEPKTLNPTPLWSSYAFLPNQDSEPLPPPLYFQPTKTPYREGVSVRTQFYFKIKVR